ncbi:hypothetical protein M0R72_16705 [Candidatus Pacearchaeota archaeon]|jgi:rubredoxin|nr:hypothetical protein [Candidatus Pacearchaeota archaeon]
MAKIGDYVKADEVVCPECGAKLRYRQYVCGWMYEDLTDEGLKASTDFDGEDVDDAQFVCPEGHEVPDWLFGINMELNKYVRFYSQEAYYE